MSLILKITLVRQSQLPSASKAISSFLEVPNNEEAFLYERMFDNKLILHCSRAVVLLLALGLTAVPARADEAADLAQIDQIQILGDTDNANALKQLQSFQEKLPADASYQVKLKALKLMIGLLYDAGKASSAKKVNAALMALAVKEGDQRSINFAKVNQAFDEIDDGHPEQSIAKLTEVQDAIKASSDPELKMRISSAFGAVYASTGRFELALSYYLDALKLTDLQPRRQAHARLYHLDSISRLYTTMKNPEKALATVDEALAISSATTDLKSLASLTMVQGVAYAQLDRNKDALSSFQKTLNIARDAGIPAVEISALGNIADQYLIMHNFVEAEHTAKIAYEKADAIHDEYLKQLANVNWGFALGGQGKIAQGAEKINSVIAYFESIDSKTNVEGILGELGLMYEHAGMYKEAVATMHKKETLSDDLFKAESAKAVATLQETFNADKRQKQIELLGRDNQLKDADIKNRRLQQVITLLGAMLTVMAGVFIFLLYRRVRKTNAKLVEANLQLEFHAVRDPLTGLYNRRSFLEMMRNRALSSERERRENDSDNPDCLLLLDIDHFKQINDTWGHAIGDSVLMEVAHRLKKTVRDTDMVLRWGGEEFLIYSPKSNPAQLKKLVERVLSSIGENPIQVGENAIPLTVTAGFISLPFSGIPEEVCSWEKAIQMADMALYLGKAHGRNRAYGLARLLVPHEQAMPILDHDLSAAISANMVELIEVIGPVKRKEINTN